MSEEASSGPDTGNLEFDLALSFQPAWVKEKSPAPSAGYAERFSTEEPPRRGGRQGGNRNREGGDRGRGAIRGERRSGPRRESGRREEARRGPGDRRRAPEREGRPDEREQALAGWEVSIEADERGYDNLARQIRTTAVAYPLFDLALLVLEKSERYRVSLQRKDGPPLWQVGADGSVWLSEREAVAHATGPLLERYYRRERVPVEPPKGNYSCIAVCGLSDTVIGPPNHHDYQGALRKLHADRFARMPFEAFKSRVRMVRDEEAIQKWREERSAADVFEPLEAPEGSEPVRLESRDAVERHFRQHHLATEILTGDTLSAHGPAVIHSSTPTARALARRKVDELRRHPLPLAHTLGQALSARGLHIFKAHENITYVSIARPRHLDRAATPVSDTLSGILTWLEEHPGVPREERRAALAGLRPMTEGGEGEREAAVTRDLSWLLHEGYVVDYARKGLEVVRRARPRQEQAQ